MQLKQAACLPACPAHFAQAWEAAGKAGVWIKIPIHKSALIPVAVGTGRFSFHHAEKVLNEYLFIQRW